MAFQIVLRIGFGIGLRARFGCGCCGLRVSLGVGSVGLRFCGCTWFWCRSLGLVGIGFHDICPLTVLIC